jgi:UDP-N-acetylmuramoyl-L-alanyl-D-glutamate--2,6-diaminopimelate ligase
MNGQSWELKSSLVGVHNASNLLAAQATGLALGLKRENMQVLEDFADIPGRLERVANDQGLDIFVDYAHTPDALENVLQSLAQLQFRRILVVFGCGGDRDSRKRPLMGAAVKKYAQVAIVTSDNPRHEEPESIIEQILPGLNGSNKIIRESKRREAIKLALTEMEQGDALLIAGKGHEDYQQIGDKKFPFSDVQVVKELLQ